MLRFSPIESSSNDRWLNTPAARLFMHYEQQLLARLLPRLTGYRCIQLGTWLADDALSRAGTLCQWRFGFSAAGRADVCFNARHLPVASHSVDALILPHSLELVARPHALLRECARVLNDRGQIVVLGFNALSFWALRQRWGAPRGARFAPRSPLMAASRLCDWLRLLELEPEQLWRYGPGFPFFGRARQVAGKPRWAQAVGWSAPAYAVIARRHVLPRTRVFKRVDERQPGPAAGLACSASQRDTGV